MNSIEILCTTMFQKDFSKIKSMNIHSDIIFANQANENSFEEISFEDHVAKMVTTKSRGVGLNRNIALLAATKDILLFADDDVVYVDDLEKIIKDAFSLYSKADVIAFGMSFSKDGVVYKSRVPKRGRIPIYKSLKFGTVALAVRRKSLLKTGIVFTQLFGGGCIYAHGEDSDFILQCFKAKLNVYGYDAIIGCTSKDSSTCFAGYNEKFFYDTGALAKYSFKKWAFPYMAYMAFRIKKDCVVSFTKKIKCMIDGYKSFKSLKKFEDG